MEQQKEELKHLQKFNNEEIIENYNNSSLLAKISSICLNKKFIIILLVHFIAILLYKMYNKFIRDSVHFEQLNSYIKHITSFLDVLL